MPQKKISRVIFHMVKAVLPRRKTDILEVFTNLFMGKVNFVFKIM